MPGQLFVMVLVSVLLTKDIFVSISGNRIGSGNTIEMEERNMDPNGKPDPATLNWRHSTHICALSDGERHVGHIVKSGGRWHAFDAMHSNDRGDGFRSLGSFASETSAKSAVEQCYRLLPMSFAGVA